MKLFLFLSLLTVTLHISKQSPTSTDPQDYGIAICSGVFVGPNEILTARHCMRDNRNHQWIKTSDNQSFSAEIEAISTDSDLALLIIPRISKHEYVEFGKEVKISQPIYTVNSGDDFEHTYNQGVVCNIVKAFENEPPMVLHNAAITGGASGSGLFNAKGQIVGINTKCNGIWSLAVNIAEIKRFIEETHAANAKKN